jgi:hypothetical protein
VNAPLDMPEMLEEENLAIKKQSWFEHWRLR